MRTLKIVVLCAILGGCWTGQDVTSPARPDGQFVGQNVDAVVARFGKPTGRKRLDNDQMTYVWELAAADLPANQRTDTPQGGLYGDGHTPGAISDDPRFCKISVITSREGTVTQLTAEDYNGTGAPTMSLGFIGSVCAQLEMKPQS